MSDLDKTSQQLLASIRKTKEGPSTAAVKSASPKKATRKIVKPKTKTSPTKSAAKPKATANKVSPKTKVKTRKKTTEAVTKRTKDSPKQAILRIASTEVKVPYRDGSQVWPD